MMTERTMSTQPLMERDALSPSEPATDEIVILGYDSHPSRTEAIHAAITQSETSADLEVHEKRIEDGVTANMQELDGWLQFKVKNALLAHIFTQIKAEDSDEEYVGLSDQEIENERIEKGYLEISSISNILRQEIISQRDRHYQEARQLENVSIPQAELRDGPAMNSKNPYIYWKNDIGNLLDRVDVHDKTSERINLLVLDDDEEAFRELTDEYIQRTYDMARNEVISILVQQTKDLESKVQKDAEQIKTLKDSLELLINQHVETLDNEIANHLVQQAKEIAE